MAIAKLTELPVTLPKPVLVVQVSPKTKWDAATKTAVQTTKDDVPQWSIDGLTDPGHGQLVQLTVTITSPEMPAIGTSVSANFVNLVARPYGLAQAGGRVNAGLYFTADSVQVVK